MHVQSKSQPATRIPKRLAKQPTPTQSTVPPELWSMIFSHLTASELCAAKLICRCWHMIISSTPFRALCEFDTLDEPPASSSSMIENDWIRVYVGRNDMGPDLFDYFLVPGLTPLMEITVERLCDDWDAIPSNYPLFDTIRQLVLDRCGFNVTLVLQPSYLEQSRFPVRFGIPVCATAEEVEITLATENDDISLVTLEYLSAITMLEVGEMDGQLDFKNELALMPNIDTIILDIDKDINLDSGLDTLSNLRNLQVEYPKFGRERLDEIAKLRHLERLFLEMDYEDGAAEWDEADVDALCDMFASLTRLWFFSFDSNSPTIINTIRSSEKLRRAMGNITHFVVRSICDFDSVNVIADIIETLSRLENVKNVTVHVLREDDDYGDVDAFALCRIAAYAKARELRSAALRIEIIEE